MNSRHSKYTEREYLIPITANQFHVLLALAGRQRYGYEIMQKVAQDSEGVVEIGPASTYSTLKSLKNMGFVTLAGSELGEGSPNQRRLYAITVAGRQVLEWETDRLRRAANLARHRLQSDKI